MLTRDELIFYYERLTTRGLCLSLLVEFQQELSYGAYSLLRLVRPSESDPDKAILLSQSHQQHLANFNEYIKSQLTKESHNVPEGQELLRRDGRESAPNFSTSRVRLAVDNLNNATRGTNQGGNQPAPVIPDGEVTYEMLAPIPHLSIARLVEIGSAEGVNLKRFKKGSMKKCDYIDAFVAHRAEVAHRAQEGECHKFHV